jgi:hypothetical protein
LPFLTCYFVLISYYSNIYKKNYIFLIVVSLIVSSLMTLDRAPIMLVIILFAYIKYCTAQNLFSLLTIGALAIVGIFFIGGILTFIQYNISDFEFSDVVVVGKDFIVNRVILAPNFVPIELSYGLFDRDSDKLFLEHSRLLAIFTGKYVGTVADNSLYVGPVGAIADIWRNLGFLGVAFFGCALGYYFRILDRKIQVADPITQVAISFTVMTLVFYLFYGTFFSQGVFLQIIFIYCILRFSVGDGRIFLQ